MRRLALALLLSLGWPAAHALACSCVQQTAEESFARATSVFEGRVAGIEHVASGRLRVTFDVVQTWKDAEHEHYVLTTSDADASCGFPFVAGESYLVYATDAMTGVCSGTKLVTTAGDEIAALGAGVVPVDVTDTPSPATVAPRTHGGRGGCASCAVAPAPFPTFLATGVGGLLMVRLLARAKREVRAQRRISSPSRRASG